MHIADLNYRHKNDFSACETYALPDSITNFPTRIFHAATIKIRARKAQVPRVRFAHICAKRIATLTLVVVGGLALDSRVERRGSILFRLHRRRATRADVVRGARPARLSRGDRRVLPSTKEEPAARRRRGR